jgi:HSP20 family protein
VASEVERSSTSEPGEGRVPTPGCVTPDTTIHTRNNEEINPMSNVVNEPAAPQRETPGRAVTVSPRVDVLETENEFLVLADVPGVKPEDVDIRFERGELAVHGRRAAGRNSEPTAYHRTFAVAETVAADKITADLKAGVLTIRLPKVEAVKPKRIAVTG